MRYPRDHYARPLPERWNVAMTAAGFVGSEFIDEPEKVAEEVRRMRDELMALKRDAAVARRSS